MVKSAANVDHVIMKPEIVAPKLRICTIDAGSVCTFTNLWRLTAAATTNVMITGIQAQFAYLKEVRKAQK